jgi:hypothetical protein
MTLPDGLVLGSLSWKGTVVTKKTNEMPIRASTPQRGVVASLSDCMLIVHLLVIGLGVAAHNNFIKQNDYYTIVESPADRARLWLRAAAFPPNVSQAVLDSPQRSELLLMMEETGQYGSFVYMLRSCGYAARIMTVVQAAQWWPQLNPEMRTK